jgi:hypothetical protein
VEVIMKESNIFKYSYAIEKLDTVIRVAAWIDNEQVDIAERLGGALQELTYPKSQISQDKIAKDIYDEIYSLIDYSKRNNKKGTYRINIEDMSKDVRMYIFELIFKLYFRIEELYYQDESKTIDPTVKEWKDKIKQRYKEFQKEVNKE